MRDDPGMTELFGQVGLDLALLLAPLAEGEGAGLDIRYSPEFDQIAKARHEEDDTNQGIWKTDAKKADWQSVVRLCADMLATRSKDLQVAVWLTEALVNLNGLNGLAAGFDLIEQLGTAFWETMWPRAEEGDLEPRMGPYYWLDSHLGPTLLRIMVTEPVDGERAGLSYHHIVQSRRLQKLASNNPKAYQEALADGEIPVEAVERAIALTSDEFYVARAEESRRVTAALAALSDSLDNLAGKDAPSFAELRRTLGEIEHLFTQILADRGLAEAPAAVEDEALDEWDEDGAEDDAAPAASLGAFGLPPIRNRRDAYALLEHAAEWLLRFEPHSPSPYLVKRAVSWENRPLREVLAELMARGSDQGVVFETLGMTDGEEAEPPQRSRGSRSAIRE